MAEIVDDIIEEGRFMALQGARALRLGGLVTTRGAIAEAAERVAVKLNEEIAKGHEATAFFIAIAIAAVKDALDILQLGFPVLSVFLSLILTYFLWGKGWFLKTRIRIIWFVLGIIFDNLPIFSFLPVQTIAVFYAWHIVRKRASAAEEKLENIKKLTEKEIEELDHDISYLNEEE